MNGSLQDRVLETIGRHSMIQPGDRIGVGVSGGADSVALLRIFCELRSRLGIGILVLHFNHQLRGADADGDERFAQELATTMGLEFVSDRADVAGEARRHSLNIEDAARRLRYQFFATIASSRKLNRVAVAHTADDQAETVLAHLLRGTGLTGLAGIYPVAELIIRPLLDTGRDDLRDYLFSLRQTWREDATNRDSSRMRARIRHRLLPFLLREFEPSSVTRLARLASFAREEETFWRAMEDERFATLVTREESGEASIRIADLLSPLPALAMQYRYARDEVGLPSSSTVALARRLVRRIVSHLRGSRQQVTARHVQDVLDLASKSQSGARIHLPGVLVQRSFERVVFSRVSAETEIGRGDGRDVHLTEFEYSISAPIPFETASIAVPEIQRRFNLKVIDWPSASRETSGSRGALDLDLLRWPIILRNWRPGDSYRPRGRKRIHKLKRLFLDARVPLSARAGWPVFTSGGHLIWASGYAAAEEFAPRPETRTALLIEEEKF